ncbi:MAG: hypothetical protein EZS28_056167, partial [Streblomastix strix]
MIIPFKGTQEEKKAYQEMLREELEDGIVMPIQQDQVKWRNHTFLIKKPNGTWRKILDASKLNKEKEQLGISDSDIEWQQVIGAIDNNNNLTPRSAQKQLQEMIQQSVSNQTTKQQQQTTGSNTQQRIISPLPRMISTGMNKDKPTIQSQLSVTPIQKPQH